MSGRNNASERVERETLTKLRRLSAGGSQPLRHVLMLTSATARQPIPTAHGAPQRATLRDPGSMLEGATLPGTLKIPLNSWVALAHAFWPIDAPAIRDG